MKKKLLVLALTGMAMGGGAFASSADVPMEVALFLKRREACDHWRREYGYDAERQADIRWSMCQTCTGTDAELARLKGKYHGEPAVQAKLVTLAPQIELKDKAQAQRFCNNTRKPAWQQ